MSDGRRTRLALAQAVAAGAPRYRQLKGHWPISAGFDPEHWLLPEFGVLQVPELSEGARRTYGPKGSKLIVWHQVAVICAFDLGPDLMLLRHAEQDWTVFTLPL